MYYLENKHEILGVDNDSRVFNVNKVGGKSLIPVVPHRKTINLDITVYDQLKRVVERFNPHVIVHLAEQPSAPFSMRSQEDCIYTQQNNICGTLNVLWAIKEVNPKIHLIKFGTAGEYPDWLYKDIKVPEKTRINVYYQGKEWEIPLPRYAGSWYHFSKVFDSYNIDYACKIWGLNVTDLNQGVVYGHRENTRFDYDECFGTVINRLCVQAVSGEPLTVYGTGEQQRSFIHIDNVMKAVELMIKEQPKGYTIVNQLTETHKIKEIADIIHNLTGCKIKSFKNPRFEKPKNKFRFYTDTFERLNIEPKDFEQEIEKILQIIQLHKKNINTKLFKPTTQWV